MSDENPRTLQDIAKGHEMIEAERLVQRLSKDDIALLKDSGLATFSVEGKLLSLSNLVVFAGNYANFAEDIVVRMRIHNLASRLSKELDQQESLLDKALRGA